MPENFEPTGFEFHDLRSGRDMILIDDKRSSFDGWICYRHPEGQWVSLRKATRDDLNRLSRCVDPVAELSEQAVIGEQDNAADLLWARQWENSHGVR